MAPNNNDNDPINPNQYLQIPKWINEDYFIPILEKDIPDFVRIVNFTTIAATAPGENYTSIMVRVIMEIELKDGSNTQSSYILKTCLEGGNQGAELVSNMNLFPKEKQMYQTLLPQFVKLYKQAGVDIKLSANCLHVEETPERITLVLEDLSRKKFMNVNRLKGFDMEHMRCVLHKLAELHAASAVYYHLNGPYDEIYSSTFFNESNRPIFEGMAESRKQAYFRAMREWDLENVEYYIAKYPDNDDYFDAALSLNETDPNEFNVLNHGDTWANNIMFRHDNEGNIEQTIFVDYQVGRWGTPAQDLWYLIVTSASLDIKIKEFDNFIRIYHKHLVKCLNLLKYQKPIITLRELHIMMLKYGLWGPLTAGGVMVAVLLPSDKDANMETMLKTGPEGEEFKYKTFINPYYAKAMSQLYPFFDNKGILDIIKKKNKD
ncbi:uncharacterized protein LOC119679505 [Teleopsis dalmanni]|uniref:uncharacterized protein LOC119679505 n=1 Tax=Teleopsis dalmanni TaxID=139649 RepID=UPI000D329F89|nr:uncharacterized protein LOC119679505 [Teleopsis dalmanni]